MTTAVRDGYLGHGRINAYRAINNLTDGGGGGSDDGDGGGTGTPRGKSGKCG